MGTKPVIRIYPLALFLISLVSAAAGRNETSASYPRELMGYWELRNGPCKKPGNPDSDGRLVIGLKTMWGYEDKYEPTLVLQISKSPKAWKIRSIHHIYEDKSVNYDIFVLHQDRYLTVINDYSSHTYVRCL